MWTATDRCTILTIIATADEFVETLVTQLEKLLKHDHVAKTQSRYYASLKDKLDEGQFIITLDFAENYEFIVQEAVQAFHWNNNQATLFPIVIYYRENSETKHCSLVGISDCLKHDTVSVYMFQKELITFLRKKFTVVNKIYYFSDGAPQQFKNKYAFTNLCYHVEDFNIEAEWHFFATAHGKGPCDGLAGTVKRLAARASLQIGTETQILTPLDLFKWSCQSLLNINFIFVENNTYLTVKSSLKSRFDKAKTVKGTQAIHFISPNAVDLGWANVKPLSTSEYSSRIKIFKS